MPKSAAIRRPLRFDTVDAALAEAQSLAEAESANRLTRVGSWPLGQTLGHLATWATFAFEGYPSEVRAPLPVRLILRGFRNRILTKGMMTGVRVGKVPGGTLGLDPLPTAQALPQFQSVFQRLRSECPTRPNPVFGTLTHDQWIQLNLRHAELHLSFQIPTPSAGAPP